MSNRFRPSSRVGGRRPSPPVTDDPSFVELLLPTELDDTNLREVAFAFALDQRAFGPRRVLVAVAEPDGAFLGMAHAERSDPPELTLAACLESLSHYVEVDGSMVVVWCDETVVEGPPPPEIAVRYERSRAIVASHGARLVDWFACDDWWTRSCHCALHPDEEWWGPGT